MVENSGKALEKVAGIIGEVMGIDPATITEGQNLVTDLGLSSLDVFSLTVQFEDAFNIEIPDRHIMRLVTVGDIITYLKDELWRTA